MGILNKSYDEPAFWDGQRERRIFIEQVDGRWGIYWMRGYAGTNTKYQFKSFPETWEKQPAEAYIRVLAKANGWSEMNRCRTCGLLYHGTGPICHNCQFSPQKTGGGNGS